MAIIGYKGLPTPSAERIRGEVAALEIPHLESPHGGVVTVSVGVATVTPTRADAPMLLVRKAQAALGQAKDQGRDAVFQDSGEAGSPSK